MKADSDTGKRYCAELLEKLVDIPSVFGEEEEIMLFLERELAALGLRPTRFELEPGRFCLLCTRGSGSPRLCFNAHSDTVPTNGESTPDARIEGDLLYGLGSCDTKASIAAMVTAYLEIAAGERPGTMDLLISVDEEGDGMGVKTAIAQGYSCDYAIVGEPTSLDICTVHNGLLFLTLTTTGVSAHGCDPSMGVSAIERMMELVSDLRQAVEGLPAHEVLGPASLNLGEIHAGDRPNRVPDRCDARIDLRFPPPTRVDHAFGIARRVIDSKNWASSVVEKRGETLDTLVSSALVRCMLESAAALGTGSKIIGLRGWTEAEPFRTLLGIDAVILGPGNIRQAHSANEFVSVSQTQLAAALYADVARRLLVRR